MAENEPMGFLFKLLKDIREKILEKIIIPGIDISWWEFVLGLIVVSILVTVLINAVKVTGDNAFGGGHVAREREKARAERNSSSRSSD